MTATRSGSPWPRYTESVSRTARPGRVRTRSVNRIRPLSTQPPKYPAIAPIVVPITVASSETTSATQSEVRSP